MPKAAPIMPRAPCDACGRRTSSDTGGSERSVRIRLIAAARSPAVSASVPSRSNSTARTSSRTGIAPLVATAKAHDVVDRGVGFEAIDFGEGVVRHADQRVGLEPRAARERGDFRGLEKARVV